MGDFVEEEWRNVTTFEIWMTKTYDPIFLTLVQLFGLMSGEETRELRRVYHGRK